jgi:hypothetical protein
VTRVTIPLNGDIRKAILQQAEDLKRGGSNLTTLVSAYSPEPPTKGRSLAEIWRRSVGQPRETD